LGKFGRALDWKMFIYFMAIWNILRRFRILYRQLVHFVFIWYIFPVFLLCTEKNLATLIAATFFVKFVGSCDGGAEYIVAGSPISIKQQQDSVFQALSCHLSWIGEPLCTNTYSEHGCQMVCFQTENPNLGKFLRVLLWKILVYFMTIWSSLRPFEILYGHLVYFVEIRYNFPVLVFWTKKNLATLTPSRLLRLLRC
jgi:hypothetical protein